ncbi:MAG: DUF58 domain-containing protein [Deltaproteobacteria bacterium]|nr:DUF58 domain-containing protein [Deltaproteobacteria bacterium]
MLSPDLLKKIQRIYIKSNYLANDVFAGEYETAFRGRGMEFEEVREYAPGDDIRAIDWNVTARMDRPYVKVFREEREQTVMLLIDGSASQGFGSKGRLKREVVAELAAVLAYAAIKSNDKVGLIIFTDQVERFIPPKKGRGHVWHVISEILSFKPRGLKTDMAEALNYLSRVVHRRSILFVVSDFLTEGYDISLRTARFKNDTIALSVFDPLEAEFCAGGIMSFQDLETGEVISIDMGSAGTRRSFGLLRREEEEGIVRRFRSMKIDHLRLKTDRDFIEPLLKFFRMREKRI